MGPAFVNTGPAFVNTGADEVPAEPSIRRTNSAEWKGKEAKAKTIQRQRANRGRRLVDKRAELQAREYNRSGFARTCDWMQPTTSGRHSHPAGRSAPQVRGKGQWKKWTGAAICQTAFAPPEAPCRYRAKCVGASMKHSRDCGMFTADLVESRQKEADEDLRHRSLKRPLRFYITNNMFDETKLYVAAPGNQRGQCAKRRRTIAHLCQITYKESSCGPQCGTVDKDIVRPPGLVLSCTAATTAAVVGKPTDSCGIAPAPEVLPAPAYYAHLTAKDSHSVNKSLSKWMGAAANSKNTCASPLPPPALTPPPLDMLALARAACGEVPAVTAPGAVDPPSTTRPPPPPAPPPLA